MLIGVGSTRSPKKASPNKASRRCTDSRLCLRDRLVGAVVVSRVCVYSHPVLMLVLVLIFTFCVRAYARMYVDLRSTHAIVFQVVSDFLTLAVSKFDSALPL